MNKVYIVFKREKLPYDEWRDEVVSVHMNKDTAISICNDNIMFWFCEYELKY